MIFITVESTVLSLSCLTLKSDIFKVIRTAPQCSFKILQEHVGNLHHFCFLLLYYQESYPIFTEHVKIWQVYSCKTIKESCTDSCTSLTRFRPEYCLIFWHDSYIRSCMILSQFHAKILTRCIDRVVGGAGCTNPT